jgi:hypothetical protein
MALRAWALIGLLALAFMSAGALVQPAPVRSENAADAFDAPAAYARLERLLTPEEPHPMDSDASDGMRARVLAEIEALGVQPEVSDHFTCVPHPEAPIAMCGRVRNILFSVGPADAPAILAAAHYDSVAAGPGASDAGIGVASWLEIARHFVGRTDLARRIIFLISDGEEPALLGAYAFATEDPRIESVEAIVNLEARGTSGPAVFFETNQPNADAIHAYAQGAARPMANSVMADVYALLPNSTDVTVLRREGVDIINIAVLDGWPNYHTPQDNLASVDLNSLQHMGDSALGVLRAFTEAPDQGSAESLVFSDVVGRAFISVPQLWSLIALGLSGLVALGYFWSLGGEGRWRTIAAPLVGVVIAGALAFGIGFGLSALRPGAYWFAYPEATRVWTLALAFVGAALALAFVARGARPVLVEASAMVWFAILGFMGALALPGSSILYAPPAFVFALAALIALRWPVAARIGALLAGLVAVLLWAPALALVEVALGYEYPFASTLLFALALLPWWGPMARLHKGARWSWSSAGLGGLALAGVVAAALLPAASVARPQALNITYFVDTNAQEARFLAGSARIALPAQIATLADFEPRLTLPGDQALAWSAPAPWQDIAAPRADIISETLAGDARTLRIRYTANGAYRLTLRIPKTATPRDVRIGGAEAALDQTGGAGEFYSIACIGRSCDGAELEFVVNADAAPEDWLFTGQYLGGAPAAAELIRARTGTLTPAHTGDTTLTLSRVTRAPDAPVN